MEMRELLIEPGRTEKNYWRDLWHYRELFYILAWRDLNVRYKQTAIGVIWAIIRPFLAMVIFTVVFGRIAKMPSNGIPYPILVFAAMLPWQFFANALSESSQSLVVNTSLITKVYFPRLIIPAGTLITSLVDLLISAVLMGGLMIWFRFLPDWRILTLPFFTLLTALNVKYRDFRYVIPFVLQFGLFISPVGFSSEGPYRRSLPASDPWSGSFLPSSAFPKAYKSRARSGLLIPCFEGTSSLDLIMAR